MAYPSLMNSSEVTNKKQYKPSYNSGLKMADDYDDNDIAQNTCDLHYKILYIAQK